MISSCYNALTPTLCCAFVHTSSGAPPASAQCTTVVLASTSRPLRSTPEKRAWRATGRPAILAPTESAPAEQRWMITNIAASHAQSAARAPFEVWGVMAAPTSPLLVKRARRARKGRTSLLRALQHLTLFAASAETINVCGSIMFACNLVEASLGRAAHTCALAFAFSCSCT
jgi:hypothetical protein